MMRVTAKFISLDPDEHGDSLPSHLTAHPHQRLHNDGNISRVCEYIQVTLNDGDYDRLNFDEFSLLCIKVWPFFYFLLIAGQYSFSLKADHLIVVNVRLSLPDYPIGNRELLKAFERGRHTICSFLME